MILSITTVFFFILFLLGFKDKQKGLILLILITCFFSYFVELFSMPSMMLWAKDAIILGIVFNIIVTSGFKKYPSSEVRNLTVLSLFIIIFSIASSILIEIPVIQIVSSSRYLYLYLILFLLLINTNFNPHPVRFFTILYWIILAQIPIALIQSLFAIRGDFIGGTMGGIHASGPISLTGIAFIFFIYFRHKYIKSSKFILLWIAVYIVLLALAESKVAIYVFIPIMYFYYFVIKRYTIYKIILRTLPLFLLLVVSAQLIDTVNTRANFKSDYGGVFINNPLAPFEKRMQTMNEDAYIDSRANELGATTGAKLNRLSSLGYVNYLLTTKDQLSYGFGVGEMQGNSLFKGTYHDKGIFETMSTIVILESGLIGFIGWLFLLSYLFIINMRLLKNLASQSHDKWTMFVTLFNLINLCVSFIGIFYNHHFLTPSIGAIFWISNFYMLRYRLYYYNINVKSNNFDSKIL
jgi:hypothetical protein